MLLTHVRISLFPRTRFCLRNNKAQLPFDNFPNPLYFMVHLIFQLTAGPKDISITCCEVSLLGLPHLGHKVEKFPCIHSLLITDSIH